METKTSKDTLRLICIAFLLVAAYGFLKPIKISLLASHVSISCLPLLRICSLVLHLPLLWLHQKLLPMIRAKTIAVLYPVMYGMGLLILSGFSPSRVSSIVLCLYGDLYSFFTLSVFWSMLHTRINERESGFLYPLLMLAGQCGILAPSAICLGLSLVYNCNLSNYCSLWLAATSLLLASGLIASLHCNEKVTKLPPSNSWSWDNSHAAIALGALAACYTASYIIVEYWLYYDLDQIVGGSTPEFLRMLYVSQIGIYVFAAMLALLGAYFSSHLQGFRLHLLMMPPLCLLFLICLYALAPSMSFYLPLCATIIMRGLYEGIGGAYMQALYIPTSGAIKRGFKAWVDGCIKPGTKAGSLAIASLLGSFGIILLLVPILLIWCYALCKTNRRKSPLHP